MDERFVITQGSLHQFAQLMMANRMRDHILPTAKWLMAPHFIFDRVKNLWRAKMESGQIAHHYNLDNRLYQLFLDDDWHYSAGHFEREGMTLEEAQLVKKRYITSKLAVEANHRVLDIGCGWGGLDFYIAELTGAHVTGISLSEEQLKIARRRAVNRNLTDKTEFLLQNYRDTTGSFDRIVSVEVLEHIGKNNYDVFFQKAFELLDRFGVCVIQSTVRPSPKISQGPFNEKYIFPGGYIPAVSEVYPAIQRAGFLVRDLELLPMHHATTMGMWRMRFMKNWDKAAELFDERFCRLWEFYLTLSEMAFRHDRHAVVQIQLTKRHDSVPYTRDYQQKRQAKLRILENERLTFDTVEP